QQGARPAGPDQEGGGIGPAGHAAPQPGQGDALVAGAGGGEAAPAPGRPGRRGAPRPGPRRAPPTRPAAAPAPRAPPRASHPADGGLAAGWPAPGLVTGGPVAGGAAREGGGSRRPTIWPIRIT